MLHSGGDDNKSFQSMVSGKIPIERKVSGFRSLVSGVPRQCSATCCVHGLSCMAKSMQASVWCLCVYGPAAATHNGLGVVVLFEG
jgi:hypothetical protein